MRRLSDEDVVLLDGIVAGTTNVALGRLLRLSHTGLYVRMQRLRTKLDLPAGNGVKLRLGIWWTEKRHEHTR